MSRTRRRANKNDIPAESVLQLLGWGATLERIRDDDGNPYWELWSCDRARRLGRPAPEICERFQQEGRIVEMPGTKGRHWRLGGTR